MIVEKCLEHGLPSPDFKQDETSFIATFWRKEEKEKDTEQSGESVEKSVEKVIQLIASNPKITQIELSQLTELSRRGVEKNIGILKAKGLIERIGPNKGGYWKVIRKK